MITNHTELLNALIDKYNLRSYLEIGVQNPANNFDKVKCNIKIGIDPNIIPVVSDVKILDKFDENDIPLYTLLALFNKESDVFFEKKMYCFGEQVLFDLIFIDGLHHSDQVKRDFENSLRCLSDNGFIVIHDVLPDNEEGTIVPRQTKVWWGDVYKWAMNISQYANIGYKTFNIDNGCMLVWKEVRENNFGLPEHYATWNNYVMFGFRLMNVTDEVEI